HDLVRALILALVPALARAAEAILEQAVQRQAPEQEHNLLVDGPPARRKRGERQTGAQALRMLRHARAELSEADRMAVNGGDDVSVRASFERDTADKAGGQCRRRRRLP